MKRLILTCVCVTTMLLCGNVAQAKHSWSTEMVSMDLSGNVGGFSIEIRESPVLPSPGDTAITHLGGGTFQIDSFFDVFYEMSIDGGPWILQNMGTTETEMTNFPGDGLIPIQTEILSMSLTGIVDGIPFEIRESPSLPSLGQNTITDLGNGIFQVDSFFDAYLEISIDGNSNGISTEAGLFEPLPLPGTVHTVLITPEPASMALMMIGLLVLAPSRRKQCR